MTESTSGRNAESSSFFRQRGRPASPATPDQPQEGRPLIAGRSRTAKDRAAVKPISARNKASGKDGSRPRGKQGSDQQEASPSLSSSTVFDPLAEPERPTRTGWSLGSRRRLPSSPSGESELWEDPVQISSGAASEKPTDQEGKEQGNEMNTDLAKESAKKIAEREFKIMTKLEQLLIERGREVEPNVYQYVDDENNIFLYYDANTDDGETFISYTGQGNQEITLEHNTRNQNFYLPGFDFRMSLESNNDAQSQSATREYQSTANPMENNVFQTTYYFNKDGEYKKRVTIPEEVIQNSGDKDNSKDSLIKPHVRLDSPFHPNDFGLVLQALEILEEKLTDIANLPPPITPPGG